MIREKSESILQNAFHRIKRELLDMSISAKIMGYYLVLLIISVTLSSILYQQVLFGIISGKISDVAVQMLHSISMSINTMIDTAGEYSKLILSNEEIQQSLRNGSESYNLNYQIKANTSIMRHIGGCSFISSVYLFDVDGNRYAADKVIIKPLNINRLKDADWYEEVISKKGRFVLKLNAGGIFESQNNQENFVSLIREVNDINTQKHLGVIIINISESMLKKTYKGIVNNYNTEVLVLDDMNRFVVKAENKTGFDIQRFVSSNSELSSKSVIWKANGVDYIVSYLKMQENGWKIVSIIPFRELSKESSIFSLITFIVIAANSLLLFVGSVIISRLITVPIKKLLKSMKGIEKGEFKKVDIKTGNDEIGKLRDGYNTMIGEIQNLISKIVAEQKMKRKTELDVLQAQIKPHFLYNTFDAISSLALAGMNQDVYTIMKALGTYYRTSLSKGKEVITIGEEIDVVVNYLKIQKYRYEDMFSVEYDIDPEVLNHKILKLVLQPFVENALYHGIRPMGRNGTIYVWAKYGKEAIVLEIADNGMGMTDEEILALTSGKGSRENPGFGVWGTIERLRIFYGIDDIVSIESEKNTGTKVTIRIPVTEE